MHQLVATLRRTERDCDALHVGEHVGERVRRERHHFESQPGPFGDGGIDVGLIDRAHFALRLRDDGIGPEFAKFGGIDAIDRQRLAHDGLHPRIDLGAAALGIELGLRERR